MASLAVTAEQAERASRRHCRDVFSHFGCPGTLCAERFLDEVHIKFTSPAYSMSGQDSTWLKLYWREVKRELWIGHLHVASTFRGRGLGRKLVLASERVAFLLEAHSIQVFPFQEARGFWLAVGYRPHAQKSRVLTKTLAVFKEPRMPWNSN